MSEKQFDELISLKRKKYWYIWTINIIFVLSYIIIFGYLILNKKISLNINKELINIFEIVLSIIIILILVLSPLIWKLYQKNKLIAIVTKFKNNALMNEILKKVN